MKKRAIRMLLPGIALLVSGCGVIVTGDSSVAGSATPAQALAQPVPRHRPAVDSQTRDAFESANRAIASEDWHEAIYALQALVERRPDLSGPYLNLALLHQREGDVEQAEQLFRKTLAVNPVNLAAYNQYAIFLREQGRFREAETTYLAALAVWEAHPDSHRNIGILYDLYIGDRSRALQHFTRYQELTGSGDEVVAGWIIDLQRQVPSLAQGGQTE
jgi:Flp pilus assembly protein TadD